MWLVIAAVVVIAIAAVAWMYAQRQRRARLQTHFGAEYDRTVREAGSPQKAEALDKYRNLGAERAIFRMRADPRDAALGKLDKLAKLVTA